MKYMVMECHPGYVILLDEEGNVKKAANFRYETGQIITDPVFMKEAPKKHYPIYGWIMTAAACMMLLFGFSFYQSNMRIYRSVQLSINPIVMMNLNQKEKVLSVEGGNEDGIDLLEGYDSNGKDRRTVANELIIRAMEMGYLSEGGTVTITVWDKDHEIDDAYEDVVKKDIEMDREGDTTIHIDITKKETEAQTIIVPIDDDEAEDDDEADDDEAEDDDDVDDDDVDDDDADDQDDTVEQNDDADDGDDD